jgi:hypothetical protein
MDYNIYIYDKTSGQSKPTQPRQGGSANTTPKVSSASGGSGASAEGGFLATTKGDMNSFIGAVKSSKLGKIGIALYATYKVLQKCVQVVNVVATHIERQTGDYRFTMSMNNQLTVLRNLTNPVGWSKNLIESLETTTLYNRKQEQERLLIGDSYINSYNRRV